MIVYLSTIVWIHCITPIFSHPLSYYCVSQYYDDSYSGFVNITRKGEKCAHWEKIAGRYRFQDHDFPNKSMKLARNYCRNPKKLMDVPFCYVTDLNDLSPCEIPVCVTVEQLGKPFQSSTNQNNNADLALGDINATYIANTSCSKTTTEFDPYWRITFPVNIQLVRIELKYETNRMFISPTIYTKSDINNTDHICNLEAMAQNINVYDCYSIGNEVGVKMINFTDLTICHIRIHAAFFNKKCGSSDDILGYDGKVDRSKRNKICAPWSRFRSIIRQSNFFYNTFPRNQCRTLLDPNGAWCFVEMATNVYEKQYCYVDECSDFTFNCKIFKDGSFYSGFLNKAENGQNCQFWSLLVSQHPIITTFGNSEDIEQQKNFCRNIDNDPDGPWCYTTEYENPKRYCAIPSCVLVSSFAQCEPKGCDVIFDNDINCYNVLQITANVWFTVSFPMEITPVGVMLFAEDVGNFVIETSTDDIIWTTCAVFLKAATDLSYGKLFKCSNSLISVRIRSLDNVPSIKICEFRVFVDQPKLRDCDFANHTSLEYYGKISNDNKNRPCLLWSDVIKIHKIKLLDQNFVFNDVWKEKNYCRSPILKGSAWCYVKDRYNALVQSECDMNATCRSVSLPVKCVNSCFTVTMNNIPSCSNITLKSLRIQTTYKLGMPNFLIMPFADTTKSYIILAVSKYFLSRPPGQISMKKDWNIEYLAENVKGEDLKHGIYPMRKIEFREWMYTYKRANKIFRWINLLIMVLYSRDRTYTMDCSKSLLNNSINIEDLENLGFFQFVAISSYFVYL